MPTRFLVSLGCLLIMSGCSAYYITPDELVHQLRNSPTKTTGTDSLDVFSPDGGMTGVQRYLASGLEKILCRNGSDELVYLYPDDNTQLAITVKSSGETTKLYFHTVYLEGHTLKGVRSRMLTGVVREIELSDIEKIEIYSEMTKVEKAEGK